jgi:hypothetical protein
MVTERYETETGIGEPSPCFWTQVRLSAYGSISVGGNNEAGKGNGGGNGSSKNGGRHGIVVQRHADPVIGNAQPGQRGLERSRIQDDDHSKGSSEGTNGRSSGPTGQRKEAERCVSRFAGSSAFASEVLGRWRSHWAPKPARMESGVTLFTAINRAGVGTLILSAGMLADIRCRCEIERNRIKKSLFVLAIQPWKRASCARKDYIFDLNLHGFWGRSWVGIVVTGLDATVVALDIENIGRVFSQH